VRSQPTEKGCPARNCEQLMVKCRQRFTGLPRMRCASRAQWKWSKLVATQIDRCRAVLHDAIFLGGLMAEERLVSLDAARGVGAFSVVLWHWSHFFYMGTRPGYVATSSRPLYRLLYWFYDFGFMGVDFFFVLSGFIFYYFYHGSVARRNISAAEFARRRLARLYPLYGATLLLVIILQPFYCNAHGSAFVYPGGDLADLLQAATLTSHWWPNPGFFFNGPGWSISVECFLYALFFLIARFAGQHTTLALGTMAIIGLGLHYSVHWPVGRGMMFFFTGTLLARALVATTSSGWFGRYRRWLLVCALGVGPILLFGLLAVPFILKELAPLGPRIPISPASVQRNLTPILVFPYIITLLVLVERARPIRSNILRFLGDCSYSVYLLHFPLQLMTVLTIGWLGFNAGLYSDTRFFAFWLFLLLSIGALSYYAFERPTQRWVRSVAISLGSQQRFVEHHDRGGV
jgi:peptidoglycan/LPS O-acetylase OafA/YrhL